MVEMRVKGVYWDGERMYTRNSAPGDSVYGERLTTSDEVEYREWMPNRSKLAAYVRLGGTAFPFMKGTRVLYLGAASGTTASHMADLCCEGTVYCVEFSPRSFRDLVSVCERRRNMVPILGDATKPSEYHFAVEHVDVVYQDIAQKNQASILMKNMREFGYGYADEKNILTDEVYAKFFISMLKENKGHSILVDTVIDELLAECESPKGKTI